MKLFQLFCIIANNITIQYISECLIIYTSSLLYKTFDFQHGKATSKCQPSAVKIYSVLLTKIEGQFKYVQILMANLSNKETPRL